MDFTLSCLREAKEIIEDIIVHRNKYYKLRIGTDLESEIPDNFLLKTDRLSDALYNIKNAIADIDNFNATYRTAFLIVLALALSSPYSFI